VAPSYPVVVQAASAAAPAAAAPAALPAPKTTANAASVIIKAPTDVRVSVDGQATPRNAAEETFTTPDLEPGRSYEYLFKAEAVRDGKPVSRTKRVTVRAGQRSEADFSDLGVGPDVTDVAKVTVIVPEDARVYVDGVLCPLTSTRRTFETPKLASGQRYFYTVRAEVTRDGQTRGDSRRVLVEAGKETTVEFRDLSAVQAALR
jgi:uncharacterized protein (TIGR03000 family)